MPVHPQDLTPINSQMRAQSLPFSQCGAGLVAFAPCVAACASVCCCGSWSSSGHPVDASQRQRTSCPPWYGLRSHQKHTNSHPTYGCNAAAQLLHHLGHELRCSRTPCYLACRISAWLLVLPVSACCFLLVSPMIYVCPSIEWISRKMEWNGIPSVAPFSAAPLLAASGEDHHLGDNQNRL